MLLAFNLLLLFATSHLVARRIMGEAEAWRVLLATVALQPLMIWCVTLPLGALGVLNPSTASLFLSGLTTLTFLWYVLGPRRGAYRSLVVRADVLKESGWRVYFAIALAAVPILAVAAGLMLRGTNLGVEDRIYHASFAANAIITGGFAGSSPFYMEYYPYNAELMPLWFFLLAGTDGAAVLSGILIVVLLAASGACLVRASGMDWPASFLTAALLALPTVVREQAHRFTSPDLAGPAMILAAIAFLTQRRDENTFTFHTPSVILAGLLCGWAAGCKTLYTFVPLLIIGWLLLRSRDHTSRRKRRVLIGWFALAVTATACYWYLRNLLLTGNPLFPAEVGPLIGPFTAEHRWKTSLLGKLLSGTTQTEDLKRVALWYLQWPPALLALSFLGYLGAVLWPSRVRREYGAAPGGIWQLVVAIGAVSLLLSPLVPFSGTYDVPDGKLIAVPRYMILPVIIGLLAYMLSVGGTRIGRTVALCAAFLGLWEPWSFYGIGAVLAGTLLLHWTATAHNPRMSLKAATAIVSIVLIIGIAAWVPYISKVADQKAFSLPLERIPRGPGWAFLETLPAGSRLTWFGSENEFYPLYGRRLQFAPVAVNADGTPCLPLHVQWRIRRTQFRWWSVPVTTGPDTLVENIRSLGIQFVVLNNTGTGWPRQDELFTASGSAQVVYQDSTCKIVSIRGGNQTNHDSFQSLSRYARQ